MLIFAVLFFISGIYASENTIKNDYLKMLETSLIKLNDAYVDSIDEDALIKSGIKGMLKPLDVYKRQLMGLAKIS